MPAAPASRLRRASSQDAREQEADAYLGWPAMAKTTKRSARGAATKPATRTAKQGTRRGPAKMKAHATFDLYLADQSPRNQRIIRALRKFVERVEPGLEEAVKWGNGCWVTGKVPVAYVYSAPEYVQFGFFRGSALSDPLGLLEGEGQYVRHVKLRSVADIEAAAFAALLRQAAR
jgi:hypothetical protein